MDKFIDRQKLEAHFSPAITGKDAYTAGEVLLSIQGFPSADVAPVIHAHWVLNKERMVFVCSYCGESPTDGTGHTFDDRMLKERNYRYCRYCGAKMDEEEGQR